MKYNILFTAFTLSLASTASPAALLTGTFTAFGGGYDLTGDVTGFKGNGPAGGQLISGTLTLDLDQAPADRYGSSGMAVFNGNDLNWVTFTFNDLNLAGLPGVTPGNFDGVTLTLSSSGGRDVYQVTSDAYYTVGGRLSLPHREYRLRTNLRLNAYDGLVSDGLNQTLSWTEDNLTTAGLVDGDYGLIDVYYQMIDQSADGTVNDQEYAQLRYSLLSLNVTSAVPLPAAVWLMGSGLTALAVIGRRRHTASAA